MRVQAEKAGSCPELITQHTWWMKKSLTGKTGKDRVTPQHVEKNKPTFCREEKDVTLKRQEGTEHSL